MTDYSKKRCVVCQRTGGIAEQGDGIYACKFCSTPYRPRRAAKQPAPVSASPGEASPEADRFVWFTFTDELGNERNGLYDCPLVAERLRPTLVADENKLRFLRHLAQTGRLHTEDA